MVLLHRRAAVVRHVLQVKIHPARVISLWGLVAVVAALGAAAFQLFGYAVPLWVSIPLAPFELAIGFWLLLKGIKAGSEIK